MKIKEEELKREIRFLKRENERLEREAKEWKHRVRLLLKEKAKLEDYLHERVQD